MTAEEKFVFSGFAMKLERLIMEVREVLKVGAETVQEKERADELPEWVTLEKAVELKGGAAFGSVRTKYWLMPCCGLNSKLVGGKKCWKRADVLEWVSITDETLPEYAGRWNIKLPPVYAKRGIRESA